MPPEGLPEVIGARGVSPVASAALPRMTLCDASARGTHTTQVRTSASAKNVTSGRLVMTR